MVVARAHAWPAPCLWSVDCTGAKLSDCAIYLRAILSAFRGNAERHLLPQSQSRLAGGTQPSMKLNRSAVVAILVVAQILLLCVVAGKWLYVTTHRFYVEDRTDNRKQGTSWQHFAVEKDSVVPQIITRNDAYISFEMNLTKSSVLYFGAKSTGLGSYEIYSRRDGVRNLLFKDQCSELVSRSAVLPAGREIIEIYNRGAVTLYDLRAVTQFHVLPYLLALVVLFLLTLLMSRGTAIPKVCVRASLLLFSILLTFAVAEMSLRLISKKLPYSVAEHRRDIGLFRLDPRWQFSSRYRKKMRPNSDTFTEWEYGDLVEMAIIPSDVSMATVNRYPVRTDREGFRNAATRDPIAIAALGDSFTDSLMLPVEQAWPARLEQILRIPVQNYGIAGFGPQQELYVLQDYAIQHHPHVVVVAYFAGNDIFDAESFAKFEQSGIEGGEMSGWRIKKVVARYETLYTYTLLRVAFHGVLHKGKVKHPAHSGQDRVGVPAQSSGPVTSSPAYFDRGMFRIPVQGHNISFALMPPYLRTLTYSREALEARTGWQLTQAAYQGMKRLTDREGARMVVMFIPFKSQLYLPLLERSFSIEDLNRDFKFYFRENQTDADVKTMSTNRLAQNEMMHRLCDETGMLFLDLTPALQHQIELGNTVYFPDDAHWNSAGHEVAARELAEFLRQHHLDSRQ